MLSITATLTTIAIASLLLVLLVLHKTITGARRQAHEPILLITGPLAAGKSSLFHYLQYKTMPQTYSSLQPNQSYLNMEVGKIKIVDCPGHPKLSHFVEMYQAQAILFLLDASTIAKTQNIVAQQFLDMLTMARKKGVAKIAIGGNKSDYFTAISAEEIRRVIEAGVNSIRKMKNGFELEAVDNSNEDDWLAYIGDAYDLTEDGIEVILGSVQAGNTSKWEEWINSNC